MGRALVGSRVKQEDLENNPAPLSRRWAIWTTRLSPHPKIFSSVAGKLDQLNRRYGTQSSIVAHALADIDGQLGVTVYIFGADENDVIVRTYRAELPHAEMAARQPGRF